MKKIAIYLSLVALLMSACSPTLAAQEEESIITETAAILEAGIIVTDALGRQVKFDDYPTRIVLVGKLRTMIVEFLYLFESSAGKIAAVEAGSQTSENFIALIDENIGSKYTLEKGASAEQIAPIEPDLVILKSSMKESIGDQLEKINIPVIYVDFETVDQIYRDIRILGQLLNENDRAEEIVAEYQNLFSEMQSFVDENTDEKNTVLVQITDSDQQYAYEVPSANWLQTAMVEVAGGNAAWKEAAQAGGWTEVNLEQINVWDPEYMFVINYEGSANEIVANLTTSEPFSSLKAVKEGNFKAFPNDYLSWDQPDPRWILGYSWLVYELNPDKIERDVMLEKTAHFYEFFFGLDQQLIKQEILPRVADNF